MRHYEQGKWKLAKFGPSRDIRDLAWLRRRVVVDPITGCWVWQHTCNHKGYGRYNYSTDQGVRTGSAHRLALELHLGRPIRIGLNALHRCDNPPCCSGEHLFEGTQAENLLDCREKGRAVDVRGEDNGHAKLIAAEIPAILAALARGEFQRSIARRYGVDQAQISRIKNGKAWR